MRYLHTIRIPGVFLATALALVAASLAWLPSHAGAATLNQQSDQTALKAYQTYVKQLVSAAPAAKNADLTLITSISATCPNALASATNVSATVLNNIGYEAGANLALAYLTPAQKPFRRLAKKLAALSWSTPAAITIVANYLKAQSTLLALKQRNLCGDISLIGPSTSQTSPEMLSFYKTYVSDTTKLSGALNKMLALFGSKEIAAERATVKRINSLATRYSSLSKATLATTTTLLLQALGATATQTP